MLTRFGSALVSWFAKGLKSNMVLVMIGGALGSLLRYWLSKWFNEQAWAHGFPYGTMVVNVAGSFLLGLVVIAVRPLSPSLFLLLGAGFCGGFTTFSTFELEAYLLVRNHAYVQALGYAAGSLVAGFVGIALAILLAESFSQHTPG